MSWAFVLVTAISFSSDGGGEERQGFRVNLQLTIDKGDGASGFSATLNP